MKKLIFTLLTLLGAVTAGAQTETQKSQSSFKLRVMPQVAFGGYNTAGLPNHTGTRVSLSKDFNETNGAIFSPRLEFEYIYRRNHFILTGSLLRNKYRGIAKENILFGGSEFGIGTPLRAVYRFNSYRFTYRYGVVDNPKFKLELGATALVRDAMISMSSCCQKSTFYNVGFAPLLSYSITWQPTPSFAILSYGDALGVKKGRAEDIFVGVRYDFADHFGAIAGYRLLEGGSSGDKVYTYSLFHFVSFGLEVKF